MYFRFLVGALALAAPLSASHLRHATDRELFWNRGGTCGRGSVGNGKCAMAWQCCSKRGWCGKRHCTSGDEAKDDSSEDATPKSNYDGDYSEVLKIASREPSAEEQANNAKLVDALRKRYVRSWPVPAEEVWKMLPIPPDEYPEQLQGLMWMDIKGQYGHSDIPSSSFSDEGVFTFGETKFSSYDPDLNTLMTSQPCGGAMPIFDTEAGRDYIKKKCLKTVSVLGILKRFVFADDFETAYIDQWWGVANGTGAFYKDNYIPVMYRNHPPAGACPPAENATKKERNLCAKWIRETYQPAGSKPGLSADLPKSLSGNAAIYAVFEVVGQDGLPIEPYFSAMVAANLDANATHSIVGVWQTPNDN